MSLNRAASLASSEDRSAAGKRPRLSLHSSEEASERGEDAMSVSSSLLTTPQDDRGAWSPPSPVSSRFTKATRRGAKRLLEDSVYTKCLTDSKKVSATIFVELALTCCQRRPDSLDPERMRIIDSYIFDSIRQVIVH
jgi:hypothetical protein